MAATTTTMDAPVVTSPTHSHFSHHHPLELTIGSAAAATASANCSGCTLPMMGGRDYYSCRPCSFFLHSACFKMPFSVIHPADPGHHLTLTASRPATAGCRACALPLGAGFSYHCPNCHVHYHSLCLFRPNSKTHPSHHHALSLRFSAPYGAGEGFRCDVCRNPGLSEQWLYRCDACGFDSHVDCSAAPPPTTTSRAPLTSPGIAGNGNTSVPPAGYPPIGYGGGEIANVQQQQQVIMGPVAAVPVGQPQQQFGGTHVMYHQPVGGQQPPAPAFVGGGYPVSYGYNNNMQPLQQQAVMMGGGQMGMGNVMASSALSGAAQGMAGGFVQTGFDALGGGGGDGSSNHMN